MNLVLHFHVVRDIIWFEKTIILLKRKFVMINFDQLDQFYHEELQLKKSCHITIDDGDISFYNTIFPILKKHGVPATLFVSPTICRDGANFWFQDLHDFKNEVHIQYIKELKIVPGHLIESVGDCTSALKCLPIKDILLIIEQLNSIHLPAHQSRNINYSQLIEIASDDLIEIGAHTLNHPILSNEDDITSNYEISESIVLLESLIGKKVKSFAYPNGTPNIDFSGREIVILKKNGIKLAFTTAPKLISRKDNPLSIPRLSLTCGSMALLGFKIFLFRYWNLISFVWYPELKKRRKFIDAKIKSHTGAQYSGGSSGVKYAAK